MSLDEITDNILGVCIRVLELLGEDVILHCTAETSLEGLGIVA